MANWCFSNYIIEGPKEDLDALDNIMTSLKQMEKPLVENGFGVWWCGCIVAILGGNTQEIYCRGEVIDYSYDGGVIKMQIESAWSELREFRLFLLKKLPKLKFYYQSEEPGMCVFTTNDKDGRYFPEKWLLDYNDEAKNLYIYEYFKDLPAVIEYLKNNGVLTKDVYPSKGAITAALDEKQEERPDDVSFSLGEFVVVDD